jgi:curved DNA-binding protein CbpA
MYNPLLGMRGERRHFRRYALGQGSAVYAGSRRLEATPCDYSPEGLGLLLRERLAPGEQLEVSTSLVAGSFKVLWQRPTPQGLRTGLLRLGAPKGSLGHYLLPDVLIGLSRRQLTGILLLSSGQVSKRFYFREGDLVFASSNQPQERLGDILLREGKITQEAYERSVELLKRTGKRQGAVLVQLGYLRPQELVQAVKHQVKEIILNAFQLREGLFEFIPGPLPTEEAITLRLPTGRLIYEGMKRLKDTQHLKGLLPPEDSPLSLSPNPLDLFQDIGLAEEEKALLRAIDGRRSLREVLQASGLSEQEALRTLSVLLCCRLVNPTAGDEAEAKRQVLQEETPSIKEIEEKLQELEGRLQDISHYELLQIQPSATAEQIRQAFYRRAKEFHPDRHFYLPQQLRAKLHAVFCRITEAYSTLSDFKKRSQYDRSLRGSGRGQPAVGAEGKFQEGLRALREGRVEEAAQLFAEAVYLDSTNAKYHYYYGRSLLQSGKLKEAERSLRKAQQAAPRSADVLAELGHVYLALGFPLRARRNFQEALAVEPSNLRAQAGLKRLQDELDKRV